jgi:hypothetical protein
MICGKISPRINSPLNGSFTLILIFNSIVIKKVFVL